LFDIGQGAINTAASVYAPVAVTAIGSAMNALPESVQQ
jgi:hypothetical protein